MKNIKENWNIFSSKGSFFKEGSKLLHSIVHEKLVTALETIDYLILIKHSVFHDFSSRFLRTSFSFIEQNFEYYLRWSFHE